MTHYDDMHPNLNNANNFNEGKTNLNETHPGYSYQYNALSPEYHQHGYELSLACQSGTDMAHTVGNVTAIMLQFILDLFPSNTFATALPSTKIAHRQLRHTPKQIRTQPYPMCIVNPRVSLGGLDHRLAAGSYATTLWSTTSNRFQNRSEMEKLFFDKRNGIEWRGKINRVIMYFDFVLSFRSAMEQLRWASYLMNKIPTNGIYFDIDTALEMALPDGFLQETSKYAKIPVKDSDGNVSKFVDYLNMNSVYPISYRFSSGRHKDAFYSYYMTSLLCRIGELNYTNVTKIGQTESDCPITFTIECEFNTIGMFDLSVPNPGPYRMIDPIPGAISIPIFSDVFNEKDFPLLYGWKIISRPIVKMDWGETEVNIGGIFGDTINKMIDYHIQHKMNPELFVHVDMRENHTLIRDGFYVDWEHRILKFQTVNYANTYRLIITLNQLYLNQLLTDLYGKDQTNLM
jgi:hypothetical protein